MKTWRNWRCVCKHSWLCAVQSRPRSSATQSSVPLDTECRVSSGDCQHAICLKWKLGSLQVNSQASRGDDLDHWVCFLAESQDKSHSYGLGLTWPGPISSSVIQRVFIAPCLSFPPKGIKEKGNEGNFLRQCEGSPLKSASPMPWSHDPTDLAELFFSPVRAGRAFLLNSTYKSLSCSPLCTSSPGCMSEQH